MKILLSWSSGKDAAWALYCFQQNPDHEVAGVLTTVNEKFGRVSMHGVRNELLREQAHSTGLSLTEIPLPFPCSNEAYEELMLEFLNKAVSDGIEAVAFGDIFLEDIRKYREERMARTGIQCIFPLWQQDTEELSRNMIRSGVRAIVTCVDPGQLDPSFAGREYDESFLSSLPSGVDPCGENGEFHTFAYDSPVFNTPIHVERGEIVEKDGFVYVDLHG